MNTNIRFIVIIMVLGAEHTSARFRDAEPAWMPGPYLMFDDTLILESDNLKREVNHPSRLADPIVTGYEDGCFQPYVTVVRDPVTRRFRMWYDVPASTGNGSRLAYIESEDGIHWLRPHRLLETPPIQFGASVLDEGPGYADASKRFKYAWWKDGGLQVAASPDGIAWSPLAPGVVLATNHDITGIDWDPIRKRYIGFLSIVPREGPHKGLRIPHQSVSDDLIHWKTPWPIVTPDSNASIEKGETQFYGMSAMLVRGNLLVTLVKVLRDDLNCEPDKTAAQLHDRNRPFAGIGYTVLAWSHDGEHWKRETEPFLDRNPHAGTWDRAMTWADDQIIVGDFTYIYYGGYRWGHKADRFTERQIGFAQMPRDRYIGLTAGENAGRLVTRTALWRSTGMIVNSRINPAGGELRVRLLNENNQQYPGFDWDDCTPIKGDRVDHHVTWKEDVGVLNGKSVKIEFQLKQGTIFSYNLK